MVLTCLGRVVMFLLTLRLIRLAFLVMPLGILVILDVPLVWVLFVLPMSVPFGRKFQK